MIDIEFLCQKASLRLLRALSLEAGEEYLSLTSRRVRFVPLVSLRWPRGTAAACMWFVAMRALDDYIDGDAISGRSPQWYLNRTSLVLRALRDPTLGYGVHPEGIDALLISAVRHAEQMQRPILDFSNRAWPLYVADVERQIRGEAFPSQKIQDGVDESNAILQAIVPYLRGASYTREFARLEKLAVLLAPLDEFDNLPREIERRQAHISRETLVAAGFDPERLATCYTWEALGKIPGFAQWARHRLIRSRQAWRDSEQETWRGRKWPWSLLGSIVTKHDRGRIEERFDAALAHFPKGSS